MPTRLNVASAAGKLRHDIDELCSRNMALLEVLAPRCHLKQVTRRRVFVSKSGSSVVGR